MKSPVHADCDTDELSYENLSNGDASDEGVCAVLRQTLPQHEQKLKQEAAHV